MKTPEKGTILPVIVIFLHGAHFAACFLNLTSNTAPTEDSLDEFPTHLIINRIITFAPSVDICIDFDSVFEQSVSCFKIRNMSESQEQFRKLVKPIGKFISYQKELILTFVESLGEGLELMKNNPKMRNRFGLIFILNVTSLQNYSTDFMLTFLISSLDHGGSICNGRDNLITIADDIYFALQWTNKFGKLRLRFFEVYCINRKLFVEKLPTETSLTFDTIHEIVEYMTEFYYGNLTAKSQRRFDFGNEWLNVVLRNKSRSPLFNNLMPTWAIPLFTDLQVMLKFRFNFSFVKNENELDIGNGVEADFAGFGQVIIPSKAEKYSSLMCIGYVSFEAFFLRREITRKSLNLWIEKFGVYLWPCFTAVWIAIFLTLKGISTCKRRTNSWILDPIQDQRLIGKELGLWVVSTFSMRTWPISPLTLSYRVVFLFGGIFSLLFYSLYSSLIVSSMTFPISAIKTLEDLIHAKFTLTRFFKGEPVKNVLEHILRTHNASSATVDVNNETSQLNPIFNKNAKSIAFITYVDSFFETFGAKGEICQVYDHLYVSQVPTSIIIPKTSPFKDILNHEIIKITERGLLFRYIKGDESNIWSNMCNLKNQNRAVFASAIDIPDAILILGVYFCGLMGGFAIIMLETFYSCWTGN